jgi:hypothetical protein
MFVVGDEEYSDLLKAMERHRELRIPISRKSDGAVLATVPTYRPPEARGRDEEGDL